MAKKIKFPLSMRDGYQARNIDELREYFDISKALEYLLDGSLKTWLEDRYYMTEAEKIAKINPYGKNVKEDLCELLGVEMEVEAEQVDVEEIERKKERLNRLKQYTDDEFMWSKIDNVAFDQEELADLLDEGVREIYLCVGSFLIPVSEKNVTYIGIGQVKVSFMAEVVKYKDNDIIFKNISTGIDDIEEGINKYMECDFKSAIDLLKKEANKLNGRAMFILSRIYQDGGCGVDDDSVECEEWRKKGMEIGDPLCTALYSLDSAQSEEEKIQLLSKVRKEIVQMVQENDAFACDVLGVLYLNKTDVDADFCKAVEYFNKGSDLGYWRSTNSLGLRYKNGEGVDKDDREAFALFRRAAEAGYYKALLNVGDCYAEGIGIEKDDDKATEYYFEASKQKSVEYIEKKYQQYISRLNDSVVQKKIHFLTLAREVGDDPYTVIDTRRNFNSKASAEEYAYRMLDKLNYRLEQQWDIHSKDMRECIEIICSKLIELDYLYRNFYKIMGECSNIDFTCPMEEIAESYIEDALESISGRLWYDNLPSYNEISIYENTFNTTIFTRTYHVQDGSAISKLERQDKELHKTFNEALNKEFHSRCVDILLNHTKETFDAYRKKRGE